MAKIIRQSETVVEIESGELVDLINELAEFNEGIHNIFGCEFTSGNAHTIRIEDAHGDQINLDDFSIQLIIN